MAAQAVHQSRVTTPDLGRGPMIDQRYAASVYYGFLNGKGKRIQSPGEEHHFLDIDRIDLVAEGE